MTNALSFNLRTGGVLTDLCTYSLAGQSGTIERRKVTFAWLNVKRQFCVVRHIVC